MSVRPVKAFAAVLMACALASPALAAPQVFAPAQPEAWRYADQVDIKPLVPHYLNDKGFLDPAYSAAVARPSDVYTDFFAIQAIADRTAEDIRRDFVPRLAAFVSSDEHSITLKFKSGYTVRFVPRSSLVALGVTSPFSHAEVSGTGWRERLANVQDFRAQVKAAGLARTYLLPNPMFEVERIVEKRLAAKAAPAPVAVDPSLAAYDRAPDAVLLAPEGVHGMRESYDNLVALLADHRFDWIGMEMLTVAMQPALDDFCTQPEGSARYAAARRALLDYFTDGWNGRAGPKTAPEDNYYFQLVDFARTHHARVYGMENVPMAYFFFRNGESAFGAAVRNHQWAAALPAKGHGVVFGGSAHFTQPDATNLQDFIHLKNPRALLVTTTELKLHRS
jgi:hypothetical protein